MGIFEDRCAGTDHVFQIVLTSNGCYMIQSCYRRSNLFAGFNLTEFWNAIITTGDHVLKHPGSFRVSKKLVNRLISDVVAGNLSDEMCNVVFGEKFAQQPLRDTLSRSTSAPTWRGSVESWTRAKAIVLAAMD